MTAFKTDRAVLQALMAALLAACASGGGGGGAAVSPPPPPPAAPPPPSAFPPLAPPSAPGQRPSQTSSEYRANWGVAGANAIVAWEHDAKGQGVLIGVVDDGIHPDHPELRGRISPQSIDIVAGRNALVTDQSHGSELASLMVGNFNGGQTVGVAFDAAILAVRADSGDGGFSNADLGAAIDYARLHGVDIINLSLGSSSEPPAVFRDAIARATAAGVIVVVSAGNSGQSAGDVNYPGRYASNSSIAHGLIMVAGGLNPDGALNTISNPPGTARDFYLTAPGWGVIVPDYGPAGPVPGFQVCGAAAGLASNLCRIQGTSYASPHVAGAAALVMSGFPGLTPAQVVDLLLTTADDVGAPGTDSVNGRGRLNIGRAFEPVGTLAAPMAAGVEVSAATPIGAVGAAFGDGMSDDAGEWTATGFDSYGRAFAMDFAGNWRRAAPGPGLIAAAPLLWRSGRGESGVVYGFAPAESMAPDSYRLALGRQNIERAPVRIDAELAPGFELSFAAYGAETSEQRTRAGSLGHLALVHSDTSVRLTRRLAPFASVSFTSESGQARTGLAQSRADRSAETMQATFDLDRLTLGLTYGRIRDQGGVLDMAWSDAFGRTPAGETTFTGLSLSTQLGSEWRLGANAEFGAADLAQAAWISIEDPLRTTAFAGEAARAFGPGELAFSLAQPLRVEGGTLSVLLPTATAYGLQSLSYARRSIDPSPSGRELQLGAAYRVFEQGRFSAFGEALYVLEPGHVANAEPDAIFRLGLRLSH